MPSAPGKLARARLKEVEAPRAALGPPGSGSGRIPHREGFEAMRTGSVRWLAALYCLLCSTVLPTLSRADSRWADTFLSRVEALALMQTLNATLLAARSATFTLDKWCADHKLAHETSIRARLVRGLDKPISAEQRGRLQISADEPVKFRHVALVCGERVLSEADNWYVPARLTDDMNSMLETTDTPFGRAVAPLQPRRETFAVEVLWRPLPEGWELRAPEADRSDAALVMPTTLFAHRALLFTPDRRPFAEVHEYYTREILAFSPPG